MKWDDFKPADFECDFEREDHHGLAHMRRPKHVLTEDQIDARVVAQAGDDAAWEPVVHVVKKKASIGLSASLAQRAAFLARLHRERNLESWIERVVTERVELEERAFSEARRALASKNGV